MGSEPVQLVSFNNINVNLLETNSGIFVGNIKANGWHSNYKSNSGFGSSSSSSFNNSLNVVFDNDGIDTVINDYNFYEESKGVSDNNSTQNICFDSINVDSQFIASAINAGENDLRNWRSHSKISYGFGNVVGVNQYKNVINETIDNDIIDTVVTDNSITEL